MMTKLLGVIISLISIVATVFGNDDVKSWLTVADSATGAALQILHPRELSFDSSSDSAVEIEFDISRRLQPIVGFGAGLPQSSAHVLVQLKAAQPTLYQQVLTELFSSVNGAGLSILRFPIGSCDFSLHNTSYDEVAQDFALKHFSIDADSEKIVEVLQDVQKINSNLQIIASPWSAPSWMKVWNTLIAFADENTLIDEEQIYDTYANYLIRVIQAFAERGISIDFMTLQNEPLFGNGSEYPGMYFDAKQAVRLGRKVQAKLLAKQLTTKLLSYDHNWDHPEYPLETLGAGKTEEKDSKNVFAGVAWHCYGGDMKTALSKLHTSYPDVPQYLTECTGAYPNSKCDISQGLTGFGWNHEWDMQNLLLGAVGQFAQASVKWILALDEDCGPVLPDVTFRSGRPLVSIPTTTKSSQDIQWNQDFWSLRHLSQFLDPSSSWRISHHISPKSASTVHEGVEYLVEGFVSVATNKLTVIAMNLQHNTSLPLHYTLTTASAGKDGQSSAHSVIASIADELPPFSTMVYQFDYQL